MAHLRFLDIVACDWPGCVAKRVVEVVNSKNAACGKFCRRHGKKKLDEINDRERGRSAKGK
jgi:hypothetical protein